MTWLRPVSQKVVFAGWNNEDNGNDDDYDHDYGDDDGAGGYDGGGGGGGDDDNNDEFDKPHGDLLVIKIIMEYFSRYLHSLHLQ